MTVFIIFGMNYHTNFRAGSKLSNSWNFNCLKAGWHFTSVLPVFTNHIWKMTWVLREFSRLTKITVGNTLIRVHLSVPRLLTTAQRKENTTSSTVFGGKKCKNLQSYRAESRKLVLFPPFIFHSSKLSIIDNK